MNSQKIHTTTQITESFEATPLPLAQTQAVRLGDGYKITAKRLQDLKSFLNTESLVFFALKLDQAEGVAQPEVWDADSVLELIDRYRADDGKPLFTVHKFFDALKKLNAKGYCQTQTQMTFEWVFAD